MKVAVFSTKSYDAESLGDQAKKHDHQLTFHEAHLNPETVILAQGHEAVCVFVNDNLSRSTLEGLNKHGIKYIALRCAGYNNVDLEAAEKLGITVVRVPEYSPYAVAEHAVALILSLNRKIHRAYNRVREGNFALEGLTGFDLHGVTVGVVGTGKIGQVFAHIMQGFGCHVKAFDPYPSDELKSKGVEFLPMDELLQVSDIISLHCPLTPQTKHLIDEKALAKVKKGVMLINTSRGALIDTPALSSFLKSGKVGSVGLDVYEEEGDLFFENLSEKIITDDVFMRLTTFPNVLITGHQAFFTRNALDSIASVTMKNLDTLADTQHCENEVHPAKVKG